MDMESSTSLAGDYKLVRGLDKGKLEKLRGIFKEKVVGSDPDCPYTDYGLNGEEFVRGFNEVYDNASNYEQEAIAVFKDIDSQQKGRIKWNDFLDFMTNVLKPKHSAALQFGQVEYTTPPHVKRDAIMKIVLIETEKYFCYAVLSKYGRVGLYDGYFNFLTSYAVVMAREDIHRTDEERRRRNRWVTDAIFLPDILMFVVINTSRNMTVYDASGLKHFPVWLILGFPDIAQCITYKTFDDGKRRKFCMGTDVGRVTVLSFKNTKDILFRKKHSDKLTIFYYRELVREKDYVIIRNYGRIHTEAVNRIQYFTNNRTIISCSQDPNRSVVIRSSDVKETPIVFKMRRGTNCFALSSPLKVLITGSDDGTVRVWNILVPSKALNTLDSHKSGVVDIVIVESVNVFISCSRDGVLISWDLKEHVCLQSLSLTFPTFDISGKSVDWGGNCIFPGPKQIDDAGLTSCDTDKLWERKFIIITCCNYYAKIQMNYLDEKRRNFEAAMLPPPPLQNSFLIPKDWNICNAASDEKHETPIENEGEINLDHLAFIMDKNIIEDAGLKTDINYRIAKLESTKMQMQWAVEKCAPYLALDLYETKEIILGSDLPVPNIKRVKSLVEKTQKMLTDASTRSIIFSEQSSSSKSPRSSRSSIIEFDN